MKIELENEEDNSIYNIPKSGLIFAKIRNSSESLDYSPVGNYSFSNSLTDFKKAISLDSDISHWYNALGIFRSLIIDYKDYNILYDKISYENLPYFCKNLLISSIKEIIDKSKLDITNAQKISLLTVFKLSWDDAISSLKEIESNGGNSHEYTFEESLFILHLKTYKPNFLIRYFKSQEIEDDMIFYAKCLTAAISCVLKKEGKIPLELKLDLSIKDNKMFFIKNADILIDTYLDNLKK